MLILHIKKKHFDEILTRWKKKEYRKKTKYYRSRLFNKDGSLKHNTIMLINGYGYTRPYVVLDLIDVIEYKKIYCIQLGNIFEVCNLKDDIV